MVDNNYWVSQATPVQSLNWQKTAVETPLPGQVTSSSLDHRMQFPGYREYKVGNDAVNCLSTILYKPQNLLSIKIDFELQKVAHTGHELT